MESSLMASYSFMTCQCSIDAFVRYYRHLTIKNITAIHSVVKIQKNTCLLERFHFSIFFQPILLRTDETLHPPVILPLSICNVLARRME